jgi:CheY-like chemotaxis protein
VQALVDDTLWMLKPLLAEGGISLAVDLPAGLAPVFVDATLTRQALFRVWRALLRHGQASEVALHACEVKGQTHLVTRGQTHASLDGDADWQTAGLICQQQGIRLDTRALAGGWVEVTVGLPRASQPRVLVIDDNAAIHQLFERYLTPSHYEVLHARNGQEALQLARERDLDAITLDVMMPNVDGWQVLRGLSADPATARVPVIVCSVLKEPDLAFSLGARAYLKKPVDRLELQAALARLLSPAGPAGAEPRPAPEGR